MKCFIIILIKQIFKPLIMNKLVDFLKYNMGYKVLPEKTKSKIKG